MVYILDKNGQPLKNTTRHGKVRRLLKDKKARVVKDCPFTIQLLYDVDINIEEDSSMDNAIVVKNYSNIIVSNDSRMPNNIYKLDTIKITYDKFFDIITNNAESLCGNLYLDVDGLSVEMCDLLKNYISCGFNIIFFRYNVPEILSDNFDSNITIFKIKLDIYNIKLTNTTKISDHIMIYGLPGSGKTTLCKNIAVQMCNKGADVNYFSIKPEYDIFSDVSKDINIHIIDDIIKLTDVISEYYNEMNNRYKLLSDTQVNNIIKLNDSSIKAKILIIDNLDGYLNTSNTNVLSKFKKYINSIFKLGKAVGIFLIITNQKVTNMHLNYINNVSNTILLGNIPEEFNNVLFDANLKSYNSALFNKGMTGNIPSGFGMHYNLTEFNIFKINTVETLS